MKVSCIVTEVNDGHRAYLPGPYITSFMSDYLFVLLNFDKRDSL
jgi:hypothetical protein